MQRSWLFIICTQMSNSQHLSRQFLICRESKLRGHMYPTIRKKIILSLNFAEGVRKGKGTKCKEYLHLKQISMSIQSMLYYCAKSLYFRVELRRVD